MQCRVPVFVFKGCLDMARAKRQSDEVYNQRRRARRALERLERDAAKRGTAVDAGYKQQLSNLITSSYADRKTRQYQADIQQTLSQLETHKQLIDMRTNKRVKNARNDEFFAGVLSSGQRGEGTFSVTNRQAKLFMRATQNLWAGVDYKDRYQAIKDALGVPTLYDAYQLVMSQPELQAMNRSVEDYIEYYGYELNTEDERFSLDSDYFSNEDYMITSLFAPLNWGGRL